MVTSSATHGQVDKAACESSAHAGRTTSALASLPTKCDTRDHLEQRELKQVKTKGGKRVVIALSVDMLMAALQN